MTILVDIIAIPVVAAAGGYCAAIGAMETFRRARRRFRREVKQTVHEEVAQAAPGELCQSIIALLEEGWDKWARANEYSRYEWRHKESGLVLCITEPDHYGIISIVRLPGDNKDNLGLMNVLSKAEVELIKGVVARVRQAHAAAQLRQARRLAEHKLTNWMENRS